MLDGDALRRPDLSVRRRRASKARSERNKSYDKEPRGILPHVQILIGIPPGPDHRDRWAFVMVM